MIKDLIENPFEEDIANETIADIEDKIKDHSTGIKQILDHIANGRQSEFFTLTLVASTYDLQLLIVKQMLHSAGKADKVVMFQKFAYSDSELDDLLDNCFQKLSNLKDDVERLNRTFSEVRMDINTYLKDPAQMIGFNFKLTEIPNV